VSVYQSMRKPVLSVEQLRRGIAEIAAAAKQEDARVLLSGAAALALYGGDRFAPHLEVVAGRALAALPPERALPFGGHRSRTPSGVPVDVILRADDFAPLFDEALQGGRSVPGVPLPVVEPEHLVAMLLVGGRPADHLDIATLVELRAFDEAEALQRVRRLLGAYAARALRAQIDEARWRLSR
jgi:hypothetical protein